MSIATKRAIIYQLKGAIMNNIFFKPIFNVAPKGAKGNPGTNFIVPEDSILAFDGDAAPEGYIQTTDPTGGGGVVVPAIEWLCTGKAPGNDSAEKVDYTLGRMDISETYYDYLTFDNVFGQDTKDFIVQQDFNALIIPWTYNYDTALSTYSHGAFYINNTLAASWQVDYMSERFYRGVPIFAELHTNDRMYGYTPSSDGYPQQCIKIYRLADANAVNQVKEIFKFYNDYYNVEGRAPEQT